jgi:hypothetical protein
MRLRKFAQISTSEEEEEEEMSNEHEEGEILPPEEDEDEEASLEDPKPVGKRVRFSEEKSLQGFRVFRKPLHYCE